MKFRSVIIWKIIVYSILIALAILSILPFYWMLTTSFKTPAESIAVPPTWIPKTFTLLGYKTVLTKIHFLRYMYISLITSILTILGSLITALLAAYAFSWIQFKGRDTIFMGFLSLMMVPMPVYIIPLFLIVQRLGWLDTLQVMIVPWTVSIFSIFLLRQNMRSIPKDLYDAAVIDGCGRLRFLFQIIVPLIKPAITTMVIFEFISSWNTFMWPLMVINKDNLRPIQVGLAYFAQGESTNYPALMAASTLSILPLVILFFIAQKQIIESYARSGLKE
ncbi:MAG: carbohydrate ABC transporter permease [candidate division WOR-3 bacterium]|jgi:multiple sugar transport system permease protein